MGIARQGHHATKVMMVWHEGLVDVGGITYSWDARSDEDPPCSGGQLGCAARLKRFCHLSKELWDVSAQPNIFCCCLEGCTAAQFL